MGSAPIARADLDGGLVAELWPRAPYEVGAPGGPGVIGFAFEAQEGEDAIASDRRRPFRRGANTLSWIPPGCPVYSASGIGGEYLTLSGFPADALAHPDAARRPVGAGVRPGVATAARVLRRHLVGARADLGHQAEAVDALRAGLVAHLGSGPARAAGWLTPARLAAVDRLIERRMAEPIETADLAAALGLSAGFLTLAFRGGLDTTPHRYLMERRLARARAALADTAKSVAAVAAGCGFADQAHLARHMRASLGITPSAYRRRTVRSGSATDPGATR